MFTRGLSSREGAEAAEVLFRCHSATYRPPFCGARPPYWEMESSVFIEVGLCAGVTQVFRCTNVQYRGIEKYLHHGYSVQQQPHDHVLGTLRHTVRSAI